MGKEYSILAVNPGSTSTKIAVFNNEECLMKETVKHPSHVLSRYKNFMEQYAFRKEIILNTLTEKGFELSGLSAVVGIGGLLKPISSGVYLIEEKMLKELKEGVYGEHVSNLGAIIAYEIASLLNIPSFIADPAVVDEMEEIARISGMPEIKRKSIFHALNQKSVAKRAAREKGKKYEEGNFIVAHLGGGISVGVHEKGKVIDVNDALNGEGPFTPERTGGLPSYSLACLCFSGKYTYKQIKNMLKGEGGLTAYLGTNNCIEVVNRINAGDEKAKLIYEAMAYQVAKEIGACASVLKGKADAIILTGGIAYDPLFTGWVKERVEFISEVLIYPGEDEMLALAQGALRVLKGEEKVKRYG